MGAHDDLSRLLFVIAYSTTTGNVLVSARSLAFEIFVLVESWPHWGEHRIAAVARIASRFSVGFASYSWQIYVGDGAIRTHWPDSVVFAGGTRTAPNAKRPRSHVQSCSCSTNSEPKDRDEVFDKLWQRYGEEWQTEFWYERNKEFISDEIRNAEEKQT